MILRQRLRLAPLLLACLSISAQSPQEIRALLDNRTGEAKKAVGIAAGIVGEKGRTVYTSGRASLSDAPALNGDTIFEIGSITKVFTSLLLAEMAERGEVKLDDPIAKYLPPEVKMPAFGDRQITLLDISMQVSALPRMPSNFKPAHPDNPYADYTPQLLYNFLSGYKLTRAPGEKYDYSNLAVGLLGPRAVPPRRHAYEQLLRQRILGPLGMTATGITISSAQKQRLAPGHTAGLEPTSNWDLDALAGAGAIRSSVNDMLTFLAAAMELADTPLTKAFRRLRAQHRPRARLIWKSRWGGTSLLDTMAKSGGITAEPAGTALGPASIRLQSAARWCSAIPASAWTISGHTS